MAIKIPNGLPATRTLEEENKSLRTDLQRKELA
jgi:hypothetical protein